MNFISLKFLGFLIVFLILYYVTPKKYRYLLILVGSYIFYGSIDVSILLYLLYSTIVTYTGGILLSRHKSKAVLAVFVSLNIGALLIAKYNSLLPVDLGIILPVGMSFYIFQSTTYLTDLYRGKIDCVKNFLLYAAFVAFFPTILSGPIQKSRELIPQLKDPNGFDQDEMKKGLILFIWGAFVKLLVSNGLYSIISRVYYSEKTFTAPFYVLAMVCFSLYIYADFSSYSDMARGVAKMLGIRIDKNFDNPYLSQSLSEFWNRWHRSLNSWFLENLYIPLGGNRKGTIRKYINIMIVFLVSGMWHGALSHFIFWGGINGLLVVIEGLLKPLQKKIYEIFKLSEDSESLVFLRRFRVFVWITITWLFFGKGLSDSFGILGTIAGGHVVDYFDEGLLMATGSTVTMFLTVTVTLIFIMIQCKRVKESYYYTRFDSQPILFQGMLMAALIVACIFAASASYTTVNTEFIYFQF